MTRKPVYWLTCVLMMAIAAAVSATTIVMPTDEQLIEKSPVIVRGVVVSSTPVDHGGAIWTETVLQVDEALKGDVPATVTIREIGGVLGDRITKIFGSPVYTAGERVLVFLTPTPRGDYQTTDLFVGKFTEARTLNGERLWIRRGDEPNVTLLDASFRPIGSPTSQRDAGKFEQFVSDRIGGRQGTRNYGIENPALTSGTGAGDRLPIAPNFTLISEPTVYRWFTFDSGGSAAWYAYGTQPGYTGGGINEFQTAMSSWTSYGAAKIRYSYAGTFAGPPEGNGTPNGINEVDFNDPLGEIAGSWNPSTGGVVGQGGFNGVSSGSLSWTAPFIADSTHVQQTYQAYNITEGNLVIQDGVSPSAKVSSTILAEIIAHELGHTLGFGHSADPSALMYASVTGLGPALQSDDQLAARWLYPSGTSTPPPPPATAPAAPSNLTATAASSSSATLQWSDNSSNESGFHIYFASGSSGGSFTNIGDTTAGVTGATVNGLTAGTFRFYVTAFNSTGESGPSNIAGVTIGPAAQPLSAAFNVSPGTIGTAGVTTFTFTDQSTGAVASRKWSFGDGVTSTAVSPSHVYGAAGTYTAILTIFDSVGNASQAASTMSISAVAPALQAAFTFSPSSPVAGDNVSFVDQSSGAMSWYWNFGDGSSSSVQNPVKVFGTAGTFTVTLTVYGNGGSSTATKMIPVGANVPSTPVPGSFQSLIPVTAQTNGAGGSIWRTEMTIFNAGPETASIDFTFVPGAGASPQTRTVAVFPQETRTYANVLLDLFGMPNAAGGISIAATSVTTTPDLRITSRTFADSPSGTYGQAVPDVAASDLQTSSYLTGIISTAAYRTNIGVVNQSGNAVPATLTLVDANGDIVQTASLSVPPDSFQQASLGAYFPATAGGSFPLLSLRVSTAASDAVSVYASVVDNTTQDPVYIQAMPLASSSRLTLPVVARASGANGTFWRSDVTIFNPSAGAQVVVLTFYSPSGPQVRTISLAGGRSTVIPDIAGSFGTASGSGSVDVTWTGATPPVVTSRTYTTSPDGGTYGQSVDVAGSFGQRQYVTGLRSDVDFRTNVGFVNNGDTPTAVHATVLSSTGTQLGNLDLTVAAHGLVQVPLVGLTPGVDPYSIGSCTLQASTNGPQTLFVYGSVVDNHTGDPVFFAGK